MLELFVMVLYGDVRRLKKEARICLLEVQDGTKNTSPQNNFYSPELPGVEVVFSLFEFSGFSVTFTTCASTACELPAKTP